MDFENAAQRLQRDQAKMRGRRRKPEISASAKREAERRKLQQQRMAAEREQQKRHAAQVEQYFQQCERESVVVIAVAVVDVDYCLLCLMERLGRCFHNNVWNSRISLSCLFSNRLHACPTLVAQ